MATLSGVRVLDLSQVLAGPYCTLLLGDMGAEVIKVEMPGKGDDSRGWSPKLPKGESTYFLSVNRCKKSITLNLKTQSAREILLKLAKNSDVIVENFRPGVVDRLGVGYGAIKEVNPKIIYCSISGFGQTGPQRDKPAYDLIMQGVSGLMSITGELGRPPVKVGIPVTDIAAGMFACIAIITALYAKEKMGLGQFIDVSMFDCQLSWLSFQACSHLMTGEVPKPLGSAHHSIAPYQAFKTSDGYTNIAVGNESQWRSLCETLGLKELAEDPRFKTNYNRVKNREELSQILEKATLTIPTSRLLEILGKANIPCGSINTIDSVLNSSQSIHRQMIITLNHPTEGEIKVTGFPVKFSETPAKPKTTPPLLGQHTEEIILKLGYTKEKIEKFRKENVI